MDTKEKLAEDLYRIAEIIILEEKAEDIKEIRVYDRGKGWRATITKVTSAPFNLNPKLPREMYKNVRLKSVKSQESKK
jgi:hypothetical protein